MPEIGDYAVAFIYFSKDSEQRLHQRQVVEDVLDQENLSIIGWRPVPVKSEILGKASSECEPHMEQLFVARPSNCEAGLPFERKLYIARRIITHQLRYNNDFVENTSFFINSFSSKTMTYKGMLTTEQLGQYFPDLSDPEWIQLLP